MKARPGFLLFLAVVLASALLLGEYFLPVTGQLAVGWAVFMVDVLPKVSVDGQGVLFLAVLIGLAGVVGHRFCRWLAADRPWRPRWTAAGLTLVLVLFAAGMAFTGVVHQVGWLIRNPLPAEKPASPESNARSAAALLKAVASAQADFRFNDRDGNGVQEYWRADIAGLYGLSSKDSLRLIFLIEPSVAAADSAPVVDITDLIKKAPKRGYWFKALRFADEDPAKPDPQRFAACAFPEGLSTGGLTFIISHEKTIYKRVWFGPGDTPSVYPADLLKEGWTPLP